MLTEAIFSQIAMTGIWKRLTSTLKCSTGSSSRFLTIWGGEYSSELARFELARTLCEYACLQFDERIAALKKKDAGFKGFTLEYLRLTNVSRLMDMASECLKIGKTVDMNTEKRTAAFDVLVRKLSDTENIANAINADNI